MGLFKGLLAPDIETLKRKKNTKGLLRILEKEQFSALGLQAIAALGDLRDPAALDVLRQLFQNACYNVHFLQLDALLQPIVTAVARIESIAGVDKYFNLFHSGGGEISEYALAIGVLGEAKDERALDGMIWLLGALGDLSSIDVGEHKMLLLARALGKFENPRAVPPLIITAYLMDNQVAVGRIEPYRSIDLAISAALNAVLHNCFQIDDESRAARFPGALYSLLVEQGIDRADGYVGIYGESSWPKLREEQEVRDETEESIRTLWEKRDTKDGRRLLYSRLRTYQYSTHKRFSKWRN